MNFCKSGHPLKGSECFGIDLNRNYDVIGFGVGASTDPCAENYKGKIIVYDDNYH